MRCEFGWLVPMALVTAGLAFVLPVLTVRATRATYNAPKSGIEPSQDRLEVPRLGLSVRLAEGSSQDQLKLGAGYLTGTGRPAIAGNVVIAGHRDTVFRPLRYIRPGDEITVTSDGRSFTYAVEGISVVAPSETSALAPSVDPVLTLVTCYPFYFIGKAPQRFIVRAHLKSFR